MLQDIGTALFLVFMEGMLSFDNALVLAAIASHLPEAQRKKALTYGMWGAYLFRLIALTCLTYLMRSPWVKVLGGLYLIYLTVQYLRGSDDDEAPQAAQKAFWRTIVTVELADIAFSSDSILASLAVSDKLWVLVTGGVLGITMMRVAAILFVRLIERFPALEGSAYTLVAIVGGKLLIEATGRVDFHSGLPLAFFWAMMAGAVARGFLPKNRALQNT